MSLFVVQVKSLLAKLEVDAKIVELDEIAEGADVQARALSPTLQL